MVSDKKIMESFEHKMREQCKFYNAGDVQAYLLLYRFIEKYGTFDENKGMYFVDFSCSAMAVKIGCSKGYLFSHMKQLENLGAIERVEGSSVKEPFLTYMSLEV